MWETGIVIAVVAAACLWAARRIWLAATGRSRFGCGSCPGCSPRKDGQAGPDACDRCNAASRLADDGGDE